MPTSGERQRRSSLDWVQVLEKLTQIGPILLSIWALMSGLAAPWKWLLLLLGIVVSIFFVLQARRRKLRHLVIRTPDDLKLTRDEFRGRDTDIKRIIRLIDEKSNIHLVGESGCGKTTLLEWGLLEKPEIVQRYRVVKVDSYGSDWIRGPLLAVLKSLQALPPGPRSEETTTDLIEKLRQAIVPAAKPTGAKAARSKSADPKPPDPKPVLIFFDQFDHYLVASHRELLREGVVVDAQGLRDSNRFWDCIFTLVEEERVKCVFVVETGQYPLAQAFGRDHTRFPLRRLPPGHAKDLLTRRLDAAGSPVDEPELEKLIDQISGDFDKRDLLPVEMDFALRGLRYIGKPTPKAYNRLERLPGLIALGVERQIADAADAKGFTGSEVRALLLQLVSEEEGKPRSRTTLDLASRLETEKPPEAVEDLLEELAKDEQRLTKRQQLDPASPPIWTLYHEFLVGVLLRLRDASRQDSTRLQQAHKGFQTTPWPRKLRRLLSPWAAGRFLVAGWRGRLHTGGARGFLLFSLFAWLALLAVLLTPGFLVWGAERAEKIGNEIVQRFDETSGSINREEEDALWLLHRASPLAKRRALEAFLSNQTTARRMVTNADVILQSLSGLHPERNAGMLMTVWEHECSERRQNLKEVQLQACARIENELSQADPDTWREYLRIRVSDHLLISLFSKLPLSEQEKALVAVKQAIESGPNSWGMGSLSAELLSRVPIELRIPRGRELVAALAAREGTARIEDLDSFRSTLQGAPSELEADLVTSMARVLRSPPGPDERLRWAEAVAGLPKKGWDVSDELKAQARRTLVETLRTDLSIYEQTRLIAKLGEIQNDLSPEETATAKEVFLSLVDRCDNGLSVRMDQLLWLFGSSSSQEAFGLLEWLVRSERILDGSQSSEEIRRGLRSLGDRIGVEERARLIERYRERLVATDTLKAAAPLLIVLGNIDAGSPGKGLADEILRLIETERAHVGFSLEELRLVLPTLWPDWSPAERRPIELALRSLYREDLIEKETGWAEPAAILLEELEIALPEEEARKPLEILLHRGRLPCESLAPLVTKDSAPLVVEAVLQYPVCPLGVSAPVIEKLERLEVFRIEEVGWRYGKQSILDRRKLAAWAAKSYDLDEPLLFKGVSY